MSIVLVIGLCPAPAFAADGRYSAANTAASDVVSTPFTVQGNSGTQLAVAAKATPIVLYSDSATQNAKKLTAKGLKAAKAKWKSSNTKVVTVKKGKVVAKKAGKATVTAKQGKKTFTFKVTAKKVSINKSKAQIKVGGTVALKLTGDTIKSVKTSSKAVATVSKKGVVKGVKAGTSTITLVSKKGKKYTCKITVKASASSKPSKPSTVAVTGVSFAQPSLSLVVGSAAVSNPATVQPANATNKAVTYSSSAPSVASVDSVGQITPKAAGTATITAKTADGGKTATCKVTVTAKAIAVTGVSFAKSSLTLTAGDTAVSNPAIVAPSNATNKAVTYKSADESIATVDSNGLVTPKAIGETIITAKTADGGKTATCTVVVKKGGITVSSAADLKKALDNGASYSRITFDSKKSESITLDTDSDLTDTELVINAPNATIDNKVKYKSVSIDAIAANTYTEHANNSIAVAAETSHIVIAQNAVATVNAKPEVKSLVLENSGRVNKLTVGTAGKVNIKQRSESVQAVISIEVTARATIETNATLDVTANVKASLVLQPGSEGTEVKVTDSKDIPDVAGVSTVRATIVTDSGAVVDSYTVVAVYSADVETVTIPELTGRVVKPNDSADSEGGAGLARAKVELYHFEQTDSAAALQVQETDENGYFMLSNVPAGNYTLVISAEGYGESHQNLFVDNMSNSRSIGDFYLVSADEGDAEGGISGVVIDATQQGDYPIEGINIRVRTGASNVTGKVVATAVTGEDGTYKVEGVDGFALKSGVYTVEAVDLRNGVEPSYRSAKKTVVVRAGVVANCKIGMSPGVDFGQIQFKLVWNGPGGETPADVDSHLYGPRADGGLFHTYYSDKEYRSGDNLIADLDRDVTDYEGPETTTVRQLEPGIYTFFLHDYTNRESSDSTALGNSGSVVTVTIGTVTKPFPVPVGQKGTVWEVCTYNSVTKELTPVNKMYYESDPGAVGDALLYNGLKLDSVDTNDFVESVTINRSTVRLTVTSPMSDSKMSKIVGHADGATVEVVRSSNSGSGYGLKVIGADGVTRFYDLSFDIDYGNFGVTSVTPNGVITSGSVYDSEIDLNATDISFEKVKADLKLEFGEEGVIWDLVDDDGTWRLTITNGTLTRSYRVDVWQDWGDLAITGFESNDVVLYGTAYASWTEVELYVTNKDFEALKDKIKPIFASDNVHLVDVRWDDDDDEIAIDITDGVRTRTYWVDLYLETRPVVSSIELNDVIVDYTIDNEWNEIYFDVTDASPEAWANQSKFVASCSGEGATGSFREYDEDDDGILFDVVSSAGQRTYWVYARCETA